MNGATIINAEILHKKIKLATSRRGNHITKHVTELKNLLLNKLNNHLCYALLLSSAIIILSVTSLPLDSEQSNLEYQSKAKRDMMINRTKFEVTKRNQHFMDEDRNDDCEPANKAQAETFWHAWSQVSSILATPSPIHGNRCYNYVSKQYH